VFVGWDNTPRRGRRGVVIANATPERFASALTQVINVARSHPSGEQVVFVNAWNEWAEGNHLEPDLRYGRAYLSALKETIDRESAA
jgi:lipopolysaccharide biosynthesis protein